MNKYFMAKTYENFNMAKIDRNEIIIVKIKMV
jgi:hypothetical protein